MPIKDPVERAEYNRQRYQRLKQERSDYSRWVHLKHRYSLTKDAVDAILAAQRECCYLCEEALDMARLNKIHVDHDHSCCPGSRSCGRCVRGLSCDDCNRGIGMFKDDVDRMRRVADNLEKANTQLKAGPIIVIDEIRKTLPRMAECHPDRKHYGHGMCRNCWRRKPDENLAPLEDGSRQVRSHML